MTESHYFDPSAWRLAPARTVHVVIDDQNDFLHPDGWYATHEIDIAHMRRVIEPTKVLNEECRRARGPDRVDAPRHARRRRRRPVHGEARAAARRRTPHRHLGLRDPRASSTPRPEDWTSRRRACRRSSRPTSSRSCARSARRRCSSPACSRTSASARPARTRCSATSSRSSWRSASARRRRTSTIPRSR